MKRLLTILAATVLIGIIAALWIAHSRTQDQLHEAEQNLQQTRAQIAQLEAENQSLSESVARTKASSETQLQELLRLRAKVAELQRQNQESQQQLSRATNQVLPSASATPASPPPTEGIPRESWAFVGYQTPQNALQSLVWAMSTGDVKTFWASLSPKAQEMMTKQYAGKSEAEIADALKREIRLITTLRTDRIRSATETEVSIVVTSTEREEGGVKSKDEGLIKFINIGGEWKMNDL